MLTGNKGKNNKGPDNIIEVLRLGSMIEKIEKRRLHWYEYIKRMREERLPKEWKN